MKLSIITINRDNSEGLRKTIESVVAQTYTDYEYIVIDGASTDESVSIIKQYENKISYWVSEQDKGIYDAMNKGILQAHGEYCLFVNSGDVLYSVDVLERCQRNINQCDVYAGFVFDGRKNIYPPNILSFRYLYYQNIPHQSEFIKRELLLRYGLYSTDLKILSDYEFNIKMANIGCSYEILNCCVSKIEPNGISTREIELLDLERERIFNRLFLKGVLEDYVFWLEDRKIVAIYSFLKRHKMVYLLFKFLYKLLER